jgi:hypothetical protein
LAPADNRQTRRHIIPYKKKTLIKHAAGCT